MRCGRALVLLAIGLVTALAVEAAEEGFRPDTSKSR
jgi:hypothetical protein